MSKLIPERIKHGDIIDDKKVSYIEITEGNVDNGYGYFDSKVNYSQNVYKVLGINMDLIKYKSDWVGVYVFDEEGKKIISYYFDNTYGHSGIIGIF